MRDLNVRNLKSIWIIERYFEQLKADYPDIVEKYFYKKYWTI